MRRLMAAVLLLCILLTACGSKSDELVVEVQREAAAVTATEAIPETTVTVPTTIPSTQATSETTEPSTEPETEPPTEPPPEPPAETYAEEPTESTASEDTTETVSEGQNYVLNQNSKKFHYPHCGSVKQMKAKNRKDFFGTREELISKGYDPCKNCHP